jgi:hypothetical protein
VQGLGLGISPRALVTIRPCAQVAFGLVREALVQADIVCTKSFDKLALVDKLQLAWPRPSRARKPRHFFPALYFVVGQHEMCGHPLDDGTTRPNPGNFYLE